MRAVATCLMAAAAASTAAATGLEAVQWHSAATVAHPAPHHEDLDSPRFATGNVEQPPVVCPLTRVRTLSTLFVTAGAPSASSQAARDIISGLVTQYNGTSEILAGSGADAMTPPTGKFVEWRLGSVDAPLPNLRDFDIVVYWDTYNLPPGMDRWSPSHTATPSPTPSHSATPSATAEFNIISSSSPSASASPSGIPSHTASPAPPLILAQCGSFGDAVKPWLLGTSGGSDGGFGFGGVSEPRHAVLDGRVLSAFGNDPDDPLAKPEQAKRELTNEWLALATTPRGGLLVLSHPTGKSTGKCVNAVMAALDFGTFGAPAGAAAAPAGSPPSEIAANERATLWMCPSSALYLTDKVFSVFGRGKNQGSRYAVSGGHGGAIAPIGVQGNGLYLQGIAYFNDDLGKAAVSTTIKKDDNREMLAATIASPATGRFDIKSCGSNVRFVANITRLSQQPPYVIAWYDTLLLPVPAASGAGGDGPTDPAAAGSLPGSDGRVGAPAATIIATHTIDAIAASDLRMPALAGFNATLTNGTHRITLVVRDNEGSRTATSIVVNVQDSSVDARSALDIAESNKALKTQALRNLTHTMQAAEARSEMLGAQIEKLGAQTVHAEHVVNDTEAAATATAADVGALAGKIAALGSIKEDRHSTLAALESEVQHGARLLADATLHYKAMQAQAGTATTEGAEVEKLKSQQMSLQARHAELDSRLASLQQQLADTKTGIVAAESAAGDAANNATAAHDHMKKEVLESQQKLGHVKADTAAAAKKLADAQHILAGLQKELAAISAENVPLKGKRDSTEATLRADIDALATALAAASATDASAHAMLLRAQQQLATIDVQIVLPGAAPAAGAEGGAEASAGAASHSGDAAPAPPPPAAGGASLDAVLANATLPADAVTASGYASDVRTLEEKRDSKAAQLAELKRQLKLAEAKHSQQVFYGKTLDDHLAEQAAALVRSKREVEETWAAVASTNAAAEDLQHTLAAAIQTQKEAEARRANATETVAALHRQQAALEAEVASLVRDEARWRALADDMDAMAAVKKQHAARGKQQAA